MVSYNLECFDHVRAPSEENGRSPRLSPPKSSEADGVPEKSCRRESQESLKVSDLLIQQTFLIAETATNIFSARTHYKLVTQVES